MGNLRSINNVEITTRFMGVDDTSLNFPLSISRLANAAQTSVHVVRNYVVEGLLCCCDHTSAGHGRYDQCALNRLRLIRTARAAGFLILDIKPLLKTLNSGDQKACEDALRTMQSKILEQQECLHYLKKQLIHLEKL